MTTTVKAGRRGKQPPLKKKRRKKSSGTMTKAELRQLLGIVPDPQPRVNRKKLAKQVKERWSRMQVSPYEFFHWFSVVISLHIGRISAKAESKPNLFETHRISDEDVGVLKLLDQLLLVYEHRDRIQTIGDIMNLIEGRTPVSEGGEADAASP